MLYVYIFMFLFQSIIQQDTDGVSHGKIKWQKER